MSAKYTIVQGDPRTQGRQALELTLRNLDAPAEVTTARFPKYYQQNPVGPPLLFFAQEVESGRLVGMNTLFPIELWVGGEVVRGAIPGDFVVDQGHRALGPALALQRAINDALQASGLRFAYGLPNRFSDPVTARTGYEEVGRLTRFVKILRTRALAGALARRPALARLVALLGPYAVDPVLSVASRERLHRRRKDVHIEHVDRFDERFLAVFDEMSQQHSITTRRTPELLNWKYERGHEAEGVPGRSVLACIERDAKVLGYVVYKTIEGARYVEDVGFTASRPVVDMLLSEFILDARRHKVEAISVTHLGSESLLTRRLRSFGFVRRPEPTRLRVFVPDGGALRADLLDKDNWYFLGGDSDV